MPRSFSFEAVVALLAMVVIPQARSAEAYDNCTGFIDSVPATIATQGTWCLRKNLATAIAGGSAISIAANNVTIDCNDFKVGGLAAGPGTLAKGIQAQDLQNITIRQCNLRGFNVGIELSGIGGGGGGHLVEDNRLDNNTFVGIEIHGDNNLVRRNRVFDTGGFSGDMDTYGIRGSADMIGNTVSGVFPGEGGVAVWGIYVMGGEAEVRDNLVRGLVIDAGEAHGLWALNANSVTFTDNRVTASAITSGYGIHGAFCTGNVVSNFLNPFDCEFSQGNLTQEAP